MTQPLTTTLSGDYFSVRLQSNNLLREKPEQVDVVFDGDPTDLLHIHVGPVSLAFHLHDWHTIVTAVNTATGALEFSHAR